MKISCVPIKEIFSNVSNGYRVVSCEPLEADAKIKLNKYGNFSLSGTNLEDLQIGQEANIIVEEDENGKYPASYVLTGYMGIAIENGTITVDHRYSHEILSRIMEPIQAERCLEAYPDFIDLILNGKEDEIDPKNIFNVGEKRLGVYIKKVKDCKAILFYPQAFAAGIIDSSDIQKIKAQFTSPEAFEEALNENPYAIYIDLVGFSFSKADRLVCSKWEELIDSKLRCEYACLDILKENQSLGDTRLNANIMASEVKGLVPESYHYMVEAVKDSKLIYYDESTKYASVWETYKAELCIAENILERVNHPLKTPMDWEEYVKSGDFELTDEQSELLKVVQDNSIAMLTAPGGCGKTFAMKAVIRMLEGNHHSYTMLAPTGTAAKVLTKATGRRAFTIHMFLASKMDCGEFLILEESSMVGVILLARLLDYIPKRTKILFICDPSQLPSISCGNIVHDILASDVMPIVRLTKIFRYNSSGLITVATDTRNGDSKSLRNSYDDYHFIKYNGNDLTQIISAYQDLLDSGYNKQDILVLVPYNKSKVGTYAINKAIQKRFNSKGVLPVSYSRDGFPIEFKIGDRVINKKNNYHIPVLDIDEKTGDMIPTDKEMFVANGSIGVIREYYKDNDMNCFAIEFEEGIGEFRGRDIGNLLLGYAVTIHASQGNQAKAVIVVIDETHKRLLSRNICYVAFTRSQEILYIVGNDDVIEEGLKTEETNERDTWLGDMLVGGEEI